MSTKSKKESVSKKRSRVKVNKLPKSTKELSAEEQKRVKGGKRIRLSINTRSST